MITIDHKPLDGPFVNAYPEGSTERHILNTMLSSAETYDYDTIEQLKFELRMRHEIITAAEDLGRSGMDFEVFRESKANPAFWRRRGDGGFELKSGVKPYDAITDIYKNGQDYGTECATAIQIIYYKALAEVFGPEAFNKTFKNITLMNWHDLSAALRETGAMHREKDYFPGDRRYFSNPDVDPKTPEWQGENVIDLGGGLYFGHGIGKYDADTIIDALNENRREDADRDASLQDAAGRPDFKYLYKLYASTGASA
ncbi:protein-glutamine gamma-glutamyltransferase [Oscillospiraceae bacterium WX1]